MASWLELLPVDAWEVIGRHLWCHEDARSLALACPRLLPAIRRIVGTRGPMTVRQGTCEGVVRHWAEDVTDLVVRGPEPLRCIRCPPAALRLPALSALRRLVLRYPRYPADPGFWAATLETCPRLADVEVVCEFRSQRQRYDEDAAHAVALAVHGAPRLRRLSIIGYGALRPEWAPRVPAVRSTTLREYVALCPQAPVAVDGVDHLVTGGAELEALGAGKARTARVRLSAAAVHRLRHLALPHLEELDVRIEEVPAVAPCWSRAWGQPLAGATRLRSLALDMRWPPVGECALDLVRHWLGAPALRHVRASFLEPATRALDDLVDDLRHEDSEDLRDALALRALAAKRIAGTGLVAWLREHPGASVHVTNWAALDAPRCLVVGV